MATKAFTLAEEDSIIKHRFLTQTTATKGDPPLKRLNKRFIQFLEDAEKSSVEATEQAYKNLVREICLVETQSRKLRAVCAANDRQQQSYSEKQQELEAAIEQAKLDIEAKKVELREARLVKQHNEEYEVLKNLVMEHPSRAATQAETVRVQQQIQAVTDKGRKVAETMQLRRKQFALLFHTMDELNRVMTEDVPEPVPEEDAQQMDVDQ